MDRKSKRKAIKSLGNTIINILIFAYIGSMIFDFNIWLISDLTIVQFIFLVVALHFIFGGVKKIFNEDKSKHGYEDEKWERWSSQHYNQAPPPPPPPNQSFSDYDPYKQEAENKKTKQADKSQTDFFEGKQSGMNDPYNKEQKQHSEYAKYDQDYYYQKNMNEEQYFKQQQDHYEKQSKQFNNDTLYYNTFIGDFKYKESYTQLRPIEISAFIGDALIDLSRVEVPIGDTNISMNCFIGDMKVHMPNDPRIGVKINVAAFIGDGKLFDEKRGGFGVSTELFSPNYYECERRVNVQLNSFIGDLKVKRVG